MKKIFLLMLVLLLPLCVSAQHYYKGGYNSYKDNISYNDEYESENNNSFVDYFVFFGFGIGGGYINPTGNLSHSSFDLDLICMNVLMSLKSGTFEDTSEGPYGVSSSDATSFQIGILIPIKGFGNEDFIGRKHSCQIYIAPLIGFISSDDTIYDGKFMHENSRYHICDWWISDNKVTDTSCTEYGGALMVRYGCGYLLGKFTNKSFGVNVGFCF